MKKTFKYPIIESHTKAYIVLLVLFIALIAFLQPLAAIPCAIAFLSVLVITWKLRNSNRNILNSYFDTIASEMDETIAASVIYSPYPLCTIDPDGHIVWTNEKFKKVFKNGEVSDIDNIYDLTGLKIHEMTNEELANRTINVTSVNRSFRLQMTGRNYCSSAPGDDDDDEKKVRMVHWIENTRTEELKKLCRDAWPVIAYISIDNYDDIIANAPDEKKATLGGDIEKLIRQWATRCQGAVIRTSKSSYVMFMDARNLEINEANKFPVLDDVRGIDTGTDIPASLSIGIGCNGKTLIQTEEYASAAMDLSLGRGGDQVVVRTASDVNYFGGKLQTVEKRNKGKSRIVALALRQLIDQSPRVFVMGHKLPDMDSLGAALGVARMAKCRGKEVNIVIDTWDAVDMMYNMAINEDEHRFIRSEYAKLIISHDDLLVVVDTHRPSLAECGELTTMVDKIVIIDHHRRSQEVIQNPTLVHIEPYASSTCELVAEMLQYTATEKKELTNLEAESMLAGIAVDTKNFSVKTGVRTFEAATWLRRQGADTTVVRQFFQTDMDLFKTKASIIARAKNLPGNIALSYSEGKYKNISVLISMAADELLNIRGMRASFVLGESDTGSIRVSARSLGEINVQLIMEKVGGGGNLTTAGAQLDMEISDAVALVERIVRESVAEQEQKKELKRERDLKKETVSTGH